MRISLKKRVIYLCIGVVLFSPKSFADCSEPFSLLVERSLRASAESLKEAEIIKIGNATYETKKILGEKSSRVFLTTDNKHVVKLYSPDNEDLVQYEYWVTQYLKEKGAPVLEVIGAPQMIEHHNQKVIAVIKPYVPGIPGDRLYEAVLDANKQIALLKECSELRKKIEKHFDQDQFVKWLQMKGIKIESMTGDGSSFSILLRQGDLKPENFIYSENGWILIDP